MSDPSEILESFSGVARLFPLPNLVFFPNVMQPLHIFEPRYRQMTADALDGDKLITMALPRPGWEGDYAGRPALHPVACLGVIIAEQRLDDGRYNLLLRGVSRVRIDEEIESDVLYRTARVTPLADVPLNDAEAEGVFRQKLLELAPRMFPQAGSVKKEFRKLLMGAMPAGVVADLVAFALPLKPQFKQEMLEELNVGVRLERLTAHLEAVAPPESSAKDRPYPPPFSDN